VNYECYSGAVVAKTNVVQLLVLRKHWLFVCPFVTAV